MKVLVTGAEGFLGRRLARAFTERGDDVTGIDLLAGQDCLELFRSSTTRFDLALHCAALVGGRQNIDRAPLAVATNLALDSWFFRWLELTGTPRAVYVSSSAVYPVGLQGTTHQAWQVIRQHAQHLHEDDVLLTEDYLGRPDGTYGWVKLVGEVLARHCPAEVLVVRPFSGYAEDQSPDYPFPTFLRRARRRKDPFLVWGNGQQVRDWIHVEDIVDAILAALQQGVTGPVNLCTGSGTSMVELVGLFCRLARYDPDLLFSHDSPSGVVYRVGDVGRMLSFYTPKIGLEEGVRRAWNA
jgi:nucleoside-diphosphate-sugar epimerase